MILYHYTTVQSFLLILLTGRIRFSKLSIVDDPEEYQYITSDGLNPANYAYISCWSTTENECIPQWNLYSEKGHGVRIGMDENMFDVRRNNDGNLIIPDLMTPDIEENINRGFYVKPIMPGLFLYDIDYIDDLTTVSNYITKNRDNGIEIDTNSIGRYKRTEWAFQKEKRFRIFAYPFDGKRMLENVLAEHLYPAIQNIDIPIVDSCLQNMQITLGPHITEAEEKLIRLIVERVIKNPTIKRSVFYNNK